jgi:hypothetical protein
MRNVLGPSLHPDDCSVAAVNTRVKTAAIKAGHIYDMPNKLKILDLQDHALIFPRLRPCKLQE